MTDLTGATQKAIFQALSSVVGLPPVVSEVPVNNDGQATYPFTLLGEDQVTPLGAKGEQIEQHDFAVHICMQSTTKIVVKVMQEMVRARLVDGALIADDRAIFSRPELTSASAPLLEDGATYVGTQIFFIIAQPAS